VLAPNGGFRDLRRTYVEPDGVRTLSADAIRAFPGELLARKLNVTTDAAPQALTDRLASRRAGSLADTALSPVTSWQIPGGTLDLGRIAGTQLAERVSAAMPAHAALDSARSESLASMLVGIVNSGLPEVSATAGETIGRLGAELPFSPPPGPSGVGGIGLPGPGGGPVRRSPAAARAAGRATARAGAVADTGIARQPAAVAAEMAAQPRLRFETAGSRMITDRLTTSRAIPMMDAARALSELAVGTGILDLPLTPDRSTPGLDRTGLLAAVEPGTTVTRYARARLGPLPAWLPQDWLDDLRIEPIMAAPHFDRPMYEALDDYDRDWLVPGLGSIGFTDFVTVLETNPAFTEALLVGLSDEMGRELLWRNFPTDQRGTYFRRFWDADQDELSQDIHQFRRTPLGTHLKNDGGPEGHVVLVVRGELMRRYPEAIIMAMRAGNTTGKPVFVDPGTPGATASTLFHAHLAPDILLVGFRLTTTQVMNEPWWFVIGEHPTAPRFGLDLFSAGNPPAAGGTLQHDELDWNDLTNPASGLLDLDRFLSPRGRTVTIRDDRSTPKEVTWPGSAAVVARTLLQSPLRAAFNGKKLITPAIS
jgi:hypothetical protein